MEGTGQGVEKEVKRQKVEKEWADDHPDYVKAKKAIDGESHFFFKLISFVLFS